MVRVTEELALSPEHVALYYASDPLLGHLPVLIFHGPSTTANYTLNSSRVQVHIFSAAGFASYPRVTISPNSPFYGVVSYLPREFQGDEVCRALAFGLCKYFRELPDTVKNHLRQSYPTTKGRRPGSAPTLFGEQHAADLAKAMVPADNTGEVVTVLGAALRTQHISNVDIDLVLPPGAIVPLQNADLEEVPDDEDDILDPTLRMYGGYTPLVKLFGEPVFMPTSRLRRAPSRPTSLNRSKSFSKDQKVDLRLKMGELVDTEERYVLKLQELVNKMAPEFRASAKERPQGSFSPGLDEVEKLFPQSAGEILQVNAAFMRELRRVMEESEESAVRDMEAPFPVPRSGGAAKTKDPSGALAMARLFLEWFPKFTDCYQDYIRASQHFPPLLNAFLDQQSSFRQRVAAKGEQMIRSILIEPVQRLPRYSLFIDQIVASLPITHPALQLMLKARDIITNICSMDEPIPDKPHVTSRLRNMVECWPWDLEPQGRLILAADVVEMPAPYHAGPDKAHDRAGLLLLFSDCLVMLKKKSSPSLTGREFLRELDKPSPAGLLASMTNAAGGPGSWEFAFAGWNALADVRFTEASDGSLVWMTCTSEMKGAHIGEYASSKTPTARCFLLQEAYEGRASRWIEDMVKARIEGRFSEAERESAAWTLRSVRMQDSNLGLHAAVFQEAAEDLIDRRREPASIRVVLDVDRGAKSAPVGHYGVEVVVEIQTRDMRRIGMNTLGLNGKRYSDEIALEDFLPSLTRRIIQLVSGQFNVGNSKLVPALVSYYSKILGGLNMAHKVEKPRSFLSSSPVKMLSNYFGGSTSSVTEAAHNGPKLLQRTPLGNVATLFPSAMPRAASQRDLPPPVGSIKDRHAGADGERPENPLVRLEQTFTGYMASLQARKGYFIARTLLNRSAADELAVNDLYNRLIESPYHLDASAELGTEVVFAAFEKFVRIAWRQQIGPVMTRQALDALQVRASKQVPGDFADFVNFLFADMAPQNRRAFAALIKLLADLLDGCGNDGDRGALTLAFAELLVDAGSAHNYINLLDRLVEDCDRIFDDGGCGAGAGASLQPKGSGGYDSMNSSARHSHKSATGSLTSNTSSLRRKFGLDSLLRQNSKSSDTERPSVWRSLSKHSRNPATGDVLAKVTPAHVSRSRSIDISHAAAGQNKLRRPGSRDRPPIVGAFTSRDDGSQRPASLIQLETIGEPEMEAAAEPPSQKKRRSSLSDLKALMAAASLEDDGEEDTILAGAQRPQTPQPMADSPLMPLMPLMPLRINKQQTAEKFNATPRLLPSPSRIPMSPSQTLSPTQSRRSPRVQKENVAFGSPLEGSHPKLAPAAEVLAAMGPGAPAKSPEPRRPLSKTLSTSQIPTLRPPRVSTAGPVAIPPDSPTRPSTKPSKPPAATPTQSQPRLRLQSPQRLRERLQSEKRAVEDADAALKAELARIAEDMAHVTGARSSQTKTPTTTLSPPAASPSCPNDWEPATELGKLTAAVASLEARLPAALAELAVRQASTQAEVEAALRAAEAKVRAVDQLYREATAENELLYEKFNTELGRIVKALKGKGREDKEELVARAREAGEEVARTKKENARLKREMVSLRALLRAEVGGSGGGT